MIQYSDDKIYSPTTSKMVEDDPILRDLIVRLRRPLRVCGHEEPIIELIEQVSRETKDSKEQLQKAVQIMLDRGLLGYKEDDQRFHLTQKAVEVFEMLYVILCSKCGASNVLPKTASLGSITCQRCQTII